MTPAEKQELDEHVEAIARLLYKDADPSRMQDLGGIETVIREQLQAYVSPPMGVFLLAALQKQQKDTNAPSKAFSATFLSAVGKLKF